MPRWGSRLSGREFIVYAENDKGAAKVFCAFFGRTVRKADVDAVYKLPPDEKLTVDDRRITS
jgi:hypothetical protein